MLEREQQELKKGKLNLEWSWKLTEDCYRNHEIAGRNTIERKINS
jgi:hypothetical protein